MSRGKFIDTLMLVAGFILVLTYGCASTNGGAGVEWGSKEPANYPEVRVAQKSGPPAHAPAHGYRAKHAYRYYPAREVYYDTGRRIYFYLEGEMWKSGVSLPYNLRINLGGYQTVEIYNDTPYEYHEKIKNKGKQNASSKQAKKSKKW